MTLRHLNNRYRGSEKILRVENCANIIIKSIFIIIIIIIIISTIIIIMVISAIHPPKCELDGPASLSSSNLAFRLYLTGLKKERYISLRYISQFLQFSIWFVLHSRWPVCQRWLTRAPALASTDLPPPLLHQPQVGLWLSLCHCLCICLCLLVGKSTDLPQLLSHQPRFVGLFFYLFLYRCLCLCLLVLRSLSATCQGIR